jgi:hypothetical protein
MIGELEAHKPVAGPSLSADAAIEDDKAIASLVLKQS